MVHSGGPEGTASTGDLLRLYVSEPVFYAVCTDSVVVYGPHTRPQAHKSLAKLDTSLKPVKRARRRRAGSFSREVGATGRSRFHAGVYGGEIRRAVIAPGTDGGPRAPASGVVYRLGAA